MKVIGKGRLQKGWSVEQKCSGAGNGGCGAKLLVEESDLFLTHRFARDESRSFVTFKCCDCGVLTDVWEAVPNRVRTNLVSQDQWEKQRGGD